MDASIYNEEQKNRIRKEYLHLKHFILKNWTQDPAKLRHYYLELQKQGYVGIYFINDYQKKDEKVPSEFVKSTLKKFEELKKEMVREHRASKRPSSSPSVFLKSRAILYKLLF